MPRLSAACTALLVILAGLAGLPRLVAVDAASSQQPTASPTALPAPICPVTCSKWAAPSDVLLGEPVVVTLTASVVCPARVSRLHIVLVLDGSSAIGEEASQRMKKAARTLVRDLDLSVGAWIKVGVVEFGTRARQVLPLTSDDTQIYGAIGRIGTNGGTDLDAGIQEGARMLVDARVPTTGGPPVDVLVVMAGSLGGGNCPLAVQAANRARGQGVAVLAVCVRDACNEACLRQVAGTGRFYFTDDRIGDLTRLLRVDYIRVDQIRLRAFTIRDTMGPDVSLPGYTVVPSRTGILEGRDLIWHYEGASMHEVVLTETYAVTPTRAGRIPTNLLATGAYTTTDGQTYQWTFPVPMVNVAFPPSATPTATASPTPAPATRTPTSVPVAPSPTPTIAWPSATTEPPRTIYLPDVRCRT